MSSTLDLPVLPLAGRRSNALSTHRSQMRRVIRVDDGLNCRLHPLQRLLIERLSRHHFFADSLPNVSVYRRDSRSETNGSTQLPCDSIQEDRTGWSHTVEARIPGYRVTRDIAKQ